MSENFNQPLFPMNFRPGFGQFPNDIIQNQSFGQALQFAQNSEGVYHEPVEDPNFRHDHGGTNLIRNQQNMLFPGSNFQTNFNPYPDGSPRNNFGLYSGPDSGYQKEDSIIVQNSPHTMAGSSNIGSNFIVHNNERGRCERNMMNDVNPDNFNYLLKEDESQSGVVYQDEDGVNKEENNADNNSAKNDEQESTSSDEHFTKVDENADEQMLVEENKSDKQLQEEEKNSDVASIEYIDTGNVKDDASKETEENNVNEVTDIPDNGEGENPSDVTVISDDETKQTSEVVDSSEDMNTGAKSKKKKKGKSPVKKIEGLKVKLKSLIAAEKKEYKCPECGKVVKSLRAYEKHLNLHTDKFSCEICKKCFNSKTSLDTHQKVHQGFVGSEKCNVCDKTFYDKSSLNKHTLSVHMGITHFQCDYCERSFFAKKTYEEHVRVHTGERPFKCTICPKTYKRISDLNHHVRMHKGETKHTCEICGEGFRRISEMKRHKQKHDESGDVDVKHQSHTCEWCGINFSTGKALKQHINTHFEAMCFDKSLMQRSYGESVFHDLNAKIMKEQIQGIKHVQSDEICGQTQCQGHSRNLPFDFPMSVSAAALSERSGNYTSISQIYSSSESRQEELDESLSLMAPKTTKSSTGSLSNTTMKDSNSNIRMDPGDKKQDVPIKDDVGNKSLKMKEKFEIKVENVEEDGNEHMYISKFQATENYDDDDDDDDGDDDMDDLDDYSDVQVKKEYDADTDIEDYSYIIKDDDGDVGYTVKKKVKKQKTEKAPSKSNPKGTQAKKRNAKGKNPTRKPRKPKAVKKVDDVIEDNGYDDFWNDVDDTNTEELMDTDYTPPAKSTTKKKTGKKKGKGLKEKGLKDEKSTKEESESGSACFVCEQCGKFFSSKTCFKKHKNLHTGAFSCGHCGKSCASQHSLEIHEGLHEGRRPKPSVCNVCDKQFYDASSMNKHVKTVHMNYKPYSCTECDRRFPEKKTLVEHLRTHTGERPFKCEICSKTYKRKSELNFHTKFHTGETKLTCGECGKGFRRMSELNHHNVVKHSAERPFQCNLCEKKFTTRPQLNDHTLRHFGIKNFECPKCSRAFYTKSKLRRHLKMKSDCAVLSNFIDGKFVCRFCMSEFETLLELKSHMTIKHEINGVKQKVFTCKLCSKEFHRSQALKRHMKIHTQTRDYICNCCGAGFIQKHHLVQHLRTHTGEKPYQCSICFRSFAQNATLYSHMKHHTQLPTALYKTPSVKDEIDVAEESETSSPISYADGF